jgi:hypothetical protein
MLCPCPFNIRNLTVEAAMGKASAVPQSLDFTSDLSFDEGIWKKAGGGVGRMYVVYTV